MIAGEIFGPLYVNEAIGPASMVIVCVVELVFPEDEFVAFRTTLKTPAAEYVFEGFAAVEVTPSPKSHRYVSAFCDVLVNVIVAGANVTPE